MGVEGLGISGSLEVRSDRVSWVSCALAKELSLSYPVPSSGYPCYL